MTRTNPTVSHVEGNRSPSFYRWTTSTTQDCHRGISQVVIKDTDCIDPEKTKDQERFGTGKLNRQLRKSTESQ